MPARITCSCPRSYWLWSPSTPSSRRSSPRLRRFSTKNDGFVLSERLTKSASLKFTQLHKAKVMSLQTSKSFQLEKFLKFFRGKKFMQKHLQQQNTHYRFLLNHHASSTLPFASKFRKQKHTVNRQPSSSPSRSRPFPRPRPSKISKIPKSHPDTGSVKWRPKETSKVAIKACPTTS